MKILIRPAIARPSVAPTSSTASIASTSSSLRAASMSSRRISSPLLYFSDSTEAFPSFNFSVMIR
ncbi:secreted protein [gut metagenome]|uniref:Secreted protein n=1 Tax=gut metagenome TaxID=749906 RepID=J9FI90_9ZZZZ